ncbi:hypothetical protein BZZ08_07350 [Streptomyces sp. MH60]|nr:hypothetical protein BZZ08_07350 [Streptomyces sp. MH60]
MRSTSVFTKKPTSLSSASSVRPAIGVPKGMSVPAPSRDSSVASAVWSTMNRLDLPSRATRTRPLYTSSGSSKATRSPTYEAVTGLGRSNGSESSAGRSDNECFQ